MLTIKTSLKEFKGKGIGLITNEFIKKGKVVWIYNSVIDILFDKKSVPKETLEFFEIYALKYDSGILSLNIDNARFINHSENPNTKSLGSFKENVAIKDIHIGEEITIDYKKIDKSLIDFRVVEYSQ